MTSLSGIPIVRVIVVVILLVIIALCIILKIRESKNRKTLFGVWVVDNFLPRQTGVIQSYVPVHLEKVFNCIALVIDHIEEIHEMDLAGDLVTNIPRRLELIKRTPSLWKKFNGHEINDACDFVNYIFKEEIRIRQIGNQSVNLYWWIKITREHYNNDFYRDMRLIVKDMRKQIQKAVTTK